MKAIFIAVLFTLSSAASLAAPKDASPIVIEVNAELFKGLPRQTVEASDHGKPARFEGVLLREVLLRAGAVMGEDLRGKRLTQYVLVSAADGYRVVYSLAELDPGFRERIVLLADRRDGKPLTEKEGPFRLVVPDEKRAARWVRQVIRIEVRSAQ